MHNPATLIELVAEQAHARGDAASVLVSGRTALSYTGLDREIGRMGVELASMGIARGARVAIALANAPETAVATLSTMIWATCVPLNPTLDATTCELLFSSLQVDALIVREDGQGCAAVAVARARGLQVLSLVPRVDGAAGAFDLRAETSRAPAPCTRPLHDDIALLLHTSGTTSTPKSVALTHTQMMARSRAQPITGDDRCLCVAPLFTPSAIGHSLLAPVAVGAAIGFPRDAGPDAIVDALEALEPTYFSASPTVLSSVADALARRGMPRLRSLRFVRSSSSALESALQGRIEAAFGVPVIQGYGMTEVGTIAQNPLPPGRRKPGSVGIPVVPEIAIIDERGNACAQLDLGAVVVRGPGVASGYANDAAATREAFVDGWFRTGDTGYLDADGYLHLTGRTKEIVNRGGLKISPAEVDAVLLRHPQVREAAAFGVAHPTLGEDLAAAAVLHERSTLTAQQLREFALAHLAAYKVPTTIVLVAALARNASGKVNRRSLARDFETVLREAFVAPRDEHETRVAAVFAALLHHERIGAFDNFFALGGDSLRAMQAIARMNAHFGSNLDVESLFRWPTVAEIAPRLASGASDPGPSSTSALTRSSAIGRASPTGRRRA